MKLDQTYYEEGVRVKSLDEMVLKVSQLNQETLTKKCLAKFWKWFGRRILQNHLLNFVILVDESTTCGIITVTFSA